MPDHEHDSAPLGELIERLEKAEAGSRELDAELSELFGKRNDFGTLIVADRWLGGAALSTSVDAILWVAEKHFGMDRPSMLYSYDLNWHASAHSHMAYTATLHVAVGSPPDMQTFHGQAHTQPLAVAVALLRALNTTEGGAA